VGSAAVGIFLLIRKTQTPSSTAPPNPTKTYGEMQKVTLAVPDGWRRVTSAEVAALPDLLAQANALRASPNFTSMQYGTLTPFVASDGKTYATWVEQHYHEPGGAAKPWGLHHGVTLLAQATATLGALLDEWWEPGQ